MKSKFYMVVMLIFATTMAFSQVSLNQCDAPEKVHVTKVFPTSAQLDWHPAPETFSWLVEVGPIGFVPGVGASIIKEIVTFPITGQPRFVSMRMSGLEAGVKYDVYIRTDCEDNTEWVGPVSFVTPRSISPILCPEK